MSKGVYTAQDGHWASLLAPVDSTGGKTSPYVNLAKYAHASILLQFGVTAAAVTGVTLLAATDAAGDGSAAIPFNVFKCETAAGDVLGAKVACTASGFVPSANDGIFYVIEIDASDLPAGSGWLALAIANGSNSALASAAVFLSGARQAADQSPTVLS